MKFFQTKTVESFWRRTGTAGRLLEALRNEPFGNDITKLVSNNSIDIKFKPNFEVEEFCFLEDDCYIANDVDFVMNFLLQQGYLTVEEKLEDDKVRVKIPNIEIKYYVRSKMETHFTKVLTFSAKLVEECNNCFMKMEMNSKEDCLQKLKEVKRILNTLFSKTKNCDINKHWLESFLFHIFIPSFKIRNQKKIEETTKRGDLRTAKVLNLFIMSDDRCFVFEESLIHSAQATLQKLLRKRYYIEATKTEVPFLLISISADSNESGCVDISMMFLYNTIELKEAIEV